MSIARAYSLRWRLLQRLGVPIAVVLIFSGLGTLALASYIGSEVYDNWLYDSAMAMGDQVVSHENKAQLNLQTAAIEMFEWDAKDRIFGNVVTGHGRVLFSNAVFPDPPVNPKIGERFYYNAKIRGYKTRIVATRIAYPGNPNNSILIQVGETFNKRTAIVARIALIGLPFQVFILTIIGLSIWYAVATSLRAVNRVSAQLADYRADDLQPVADIERMPLELKPLLTSLNGLIGRLSAAQEAQQRFISNAAHQLRTPLASLQVQAERALRETDPARHSEALSQVLTALARSRHMVHQILTLARSEPSQTRSATTSVDLAELVRDELENWIDAAEEKDIDLGYDGLDTGVCLKGEAQLLRELIGNLVDNAVRYTPAGGQVTVMVSLHPVRLCVDDTGPGIPLAERARVFERFYRLGTDQTGCGLGLSIVAEIAARHGAQIHVLDGPDGKGTRIEVVFPA